MQSTPDSELIAHLVGLIKSHELKVVDYSLGFDDREYSRRAIKSYKRRLKYLKSSQGLVTQY